MNVDGKLLNTKILFDEINNSKAYNIRLKAASGNRSDFYNVVDIIIKEVTNVSGVELSRIVNSYPIRSNLWLFGAWRKLEDTENPMKSKITNIKRAYAVINNNEIYNLRLASAAGQFRDGRDAFNKALDTIIKDLVFSARIDIRHQPSSLKSNLWRFGLWRNIKIEPFKPEEEKANNTDLKGAATKYALDKINSYAPFNNRLARAAGPNKNKNISFDNEVIKIVEDINHTGHVYLNILTERLWHTGKWKKVNTSAFVNFHPDPDQVDVEFKTIYSVTDRVSNIIDNYPPYQTKLAAAAGSNKDNKEEFYEVVSDLILDVCTNNNITDTFLEKPIVDFLWHGKWRCSNSFKPVTEADFAELEERTLAYMARNNPPQEEFEMEITTPILIDGVDAADIEDSQLIHFIGNLEDKIGKREKLKTKSSRITKDIENMKKQCDQLAQILDERE